MPLVTKAECKAYIPQITAAGTSEDTLLDALIDRAEAILAQWCGYVPASAGVAPSLASAAYTIYVAARTRDSATGWANEEPVYRTLRLPVRPVTAITTIHADPERVFGAATAVASTDYELLGDLGEVKLLPRSVLGSWYPQDRAQKVVCTAGFVTTPADLKHAICLQVAALFRRRGAAGVERSSTSKSSSVDWHKDLVPPDVVAAAAPYRLPSLWLGA